MKYQAFLPHFGSMGGWLEGSWGSWVVGCWCGWWCGEGGWCACEGWVGGVVGWVGVLVMVLWGMGGWVVGGWCVSGGVSSVCGGVFMVGCAGEEWGGWVLVCWVVLYKPYMVPHTIPQGNFNFQGVLTELNFFDKI